MILKEGFEQLNGLECIYGYSTKIQRSQRKKDALYLLNIHIDMRFRKIYQRKDYYTVEQNTSYCKRRMKSHYTLCPHNIYTSC